jgi:acetyl-CoA carboxylase biotin carboxyl carrier protein
VDAGTTIGLLEVMKMFTSVTAPVAGEIAEILVENNEFVEFDQTIMLIKPESAA